MEESWNAARAAEADLSLRLEVLLDYYGVVAHEISALGIHGSAARRILPKSPEMAREFLEEIERSADALQLFNAQIGHCMRSRWGAGVGFRKLDSPAAADAELEGSSDYPGGTCVFLLPV